MNSDLYGCTVVRFHVTYSRDNSVSVHFNLELCIVVFVLAIKLHAYCHLCIISI